MNLQHHPVLDLGASALASAIARGDLSALEVTEAFITRLDSEGRRLNAVTARRFDAARGEARSIDARRARGEALPALAGVPITVKDSIDVEGLPSTFGLPWRRDTVADADDAHVARLRAQGAIVLAKSNVAQMLLAYESDNPLHGRTLHPQRDDRSPGGSSGGEAALVAVRASALGLGSDIGGSVRIPAHFCGVTGFKPTAGRCPDPGAFSIARGQLAIASQLGPIAREVRDVVLALRLMQGGVDDGVPALGDPAEVDVGRLTVGWFDFDAVFPAAPALRRAVHEAADALAGAGATVVKVDAPRFASAFAAAFQLFTADGGAVLREHLRGARPHDTLATIMLLARLGALPRGVMRALLGAIGQPTMAVFLDLVGRQSVAAHWRQVESLLALRRQALADLAANHVEVLLAPPCSLPAYTHGISKDLGVAGSYAIAVNALGWPAGVLPWTQVRGGEESDRPATRDRIFALARRVEAGSAGLPVGVQVIARPWHDHQALAVMAALERLAP